MNTVETVKSDIAPEVNDSGLTRGGAAVAAWLIRNVYLEEDWKSGIMTVAAWLIQNVYMEKEKKKKSWRLSLRRR